LHADDVNLNDKEIEAEIIKIVREHESNPNGVTKTELARIFAERWGTSTATIWHYILDMIELGQIETRKIKKIQSALFIPK